MVLNDYARPLIPLTLCFMVGIVGGLFLTGFEPAVLVGLAAAFGVVVFCLLRRRNTGLSPLLIFIFLGYLSVQPWMGPRFPPDHIIHFTGQQKWRITGTVVSRPVPRTNRLNFLMTVERIEAAGVSRSVTGRIRVTAIGTGDGFFRGDRISFESRIREPHNFNNPGGFDYKRYLAFQEVWATAYSPLESVTIWSQRTRGGIGNWIDRMRDRILELIDTTPAGDHRGVLAALILGERSRLSPETTVSFQRVGIGHLLAISGLHIGIVASTVFFLLSRILSRIPWFLWNAGTRKWAALGTFFPVLAYALLAGMSPSTQRALAMVGVFLLTFLYSRDQDLLNTLAVAAMTLLVVYPPVLFSASFQLSFAAVFAIIYGMARCPLTPLPLSVPVTSRILRRFALFVLVSVWAILGTLPLTMFYFNQVSLIGIVSNCLFVPIIGFGVVPSGLLAAFLLPLSSTAAAAIMNLAAALLAQALKLVSLMSQLPFAAIRTVTPSLFEIACYYLLVFTVVVIISRRRQGEASATGNSEYRLDSDGTVGTMPSGGGFKRVQPIWLALGLVLSAIVADIGYWTYQRLGRQDLRATFLDVGQGSATLFELPGGYCMLVDGGGYSDNAVFDVGARIIAPFLWHKKIKTVETLILTHPNSDHLNGLIYIAEHFNVQHIWSNGEPGKTSGYRQLMKTIRDKNITHPEFRRLDRQVEVAGVKIEILNPPPGFLDRRQTEPWRNLNNNSLVARFTSGAISLLLCGDITAKAEKELVTREGDRLKSTVLFVPHHGSDSSSTPGFIDAVQPQIGIVSAGWRNRYHFPHPAVLKRYRQAKTRLLRTDQDGAISLTTDGLRLSISTVITGRE
ncbi:MAG: ComEC/Rec2 family competence protein [Desulfobacterales bacterium]|jgi:competence protein ComEC